MKTFQNFSAALARPVRLLLEVEEDGVVGWDHEGWAEVLRLADRLVAASPSSPYNDLAPLVEDALAACAQASGDAHGSIGLLFESFLKLVWWLTDRAAHDAAAADSRFNLFSVTLGLGLLTEAEAHANPRDRKALGFMTAQAAVVLKAKEQRNPSVHRNAPIEPVPYLASMLWAIHTHRERLKSALAGALIELPPDFEHITQRNEYLHHVQRVRGRQHEINTIEERLERARVDGGWLLLDGPEGQGKSAVVSALLARRARERALLGKDATLAQSRAPWLSGGLLAYGKTCTLAGAAHTVTQLLAQANALLLRPVMLDLEDSPQLAPGVPRDTRPLLARARDALAEAINRLVLETGNVLLVIDALDEHAENVIDVLPPSLPPGAVGILTCRSNHEACTVARHKLRPISSLALPGLSLGDTEDVVKARTGLDEPAWTKELHEAIQGAPLMVLDACERLREADGDVSRVSAHTTMREHLTNRAARWRQKQLSRVKDARHDALLVLATLERTGPVRWGTLAHVMRQRGFDLSQTDVRELLEPVGTELVTGEDGTLQLAVRALARHVTTTMLDRGELQQLIGSVSTALAKTRVEDDSDGVLARFVIEWGDGATADAAQEGVRVLLGTAQVDRLGKIVFKQLRAASSVPAPILLVAEALLAAAPERTATIASLFLALGPSHATQALAWLERHAATGDAESQMVLAGQLLVRENAKDNLPRALKWLEAAASAGHPPAVLALIDMSLYNQNRTVELSVLAEQLRAMPTWAAQLRLAAVLKHGAILPNDPDELDRVRAQLAVLGQQVSIDDATSVLLQPELAHAMRELGLQVQLPKALLRIMELAADRGSAIHQMCHALAQLDAEPVASCSVLAALLDHPSLSGLIATHAALDERLAALREGVVALAEANPVRNPTLTLHAVTIAALQRRPAAARALLLGSGRSQKHPELLARLTMADLSLPAEVRAAAAVEWLEAKPTVIPADLGVIFDVVLLLTMNPDASPTLRGRAIARLEAQHGQLPELRIALDALRGGDAMFAWVADTAQRPELWRFGWIAQTWGPNAKLYEAAAGASGALRRKPVAKLLASLMARIEDKEPSSPHPVAEHLTFQTTAKPEADGPEDQAVGAWVRSLPAAADSWLPMLGRMPFVAFGPDPARHPVRTARAGAAIAWLARHGLFHERRVDEFFMAIGRTLAPDAPAWIFKRAEPT